MATRNQVRLVWNGPRIQRQFRRQAAEALDNFTRDLLYVAKELTPVDTGELQASVEVERNIPEMTFTLVASAPHAIWVHGGTSRMPARPFLTWAIDIMAPEAPSYFRRYMT
jgi:uncharacterized membrane protein